MLDKLVVVDMTHGGVILATRFSKLDTFDVYAWDIYKTLNQDQRNNLHNDSVKLVNEEFLKEKNLILVAPVHCQIEHPVTMTHHDAAAFLLKERIKIPVIEVTGVKGKTSVVHVLKEIFKEQSPLILSSLGVEVRINNRWKLLKRDISITPANIITAWELGQKYHPEILIVETSLGGTGLASVGILTNITEDYTIASGNKTASQAKAQIFKSDIVACDLESSKKHYKQFKEKTNTFNLTEGNVKAENINYGLKETICNVKVDDLKAINGQIINDEFKIKTFAPAPHHLENILSAICACLTYGITVDTIKSGLKKFHGLKGRTSIQYVGDAIIIQEINPGINLTAVEKSVQMIKDLNKSIVIFGGRYGVTCEEIDEKSVSDILNTIDGEIGLILTDELGAAIKGNIKRKYKFNNDYKKAVNQALQNDYKNILLIHRSNFPDLEHR